MAVDNASSCLVDAVCLPSVAFAANAQSSAPPVHVTRYQMSSPGRGPAPHYPGERPDTSFVVDGTTVYPLRPAPDGRSWQVRETDGWQDADRWLTHRGHSRLSERVAVLSYGSNANPAELSRIAKDCPIVAIRGAVFGAAAAYCSTQRSRDDQYPAGLVEESPSIGEWHTILLITPEQQNVLNAKEGTRSGHYELRHLATGAGVEFVTENGLRWSSPLPVYLQGRWRPIARVAGEPLLLREYTQEQAGALISAEATLSVSLSSVRADTLLPLSTEPIPLFAYGTLQPGQSRWAAIQHLVQGTEPAEALARRIDTGFGYPGVVDLGKGCTTGTLLIPHEDTYHEFLRLLDSIEGHPSLFTRTLIQVQTGQLAWIYAWNGA